mmetsp:Transcript_64720/g.138665  ORF Transcript_64720/g.138665 Transcript_64720/m.138665 type:complete len:290 (-) Transcript_64720:54-923(-)
MHSDSRPTFSPTCTSVDHKPCAAVSCGVSSELMLLISDMLRSSTIRLEASSPFEWIGLPSESAASSGIISRPRMAGEAGRKLWFSWRSFLLLLRSFFDSASRRFSLSKAHVRCSRAEPAVSMHIFKWLCGSKGPTPSVCSRNSCKSPVTCSVRMDFFGGVSNTASGSGRTGTRVMPICENDSTETSLENESTTTVCRAASDPQHGLMLRMKFGSGSSSSDPSHIPLCMGPSAWSQLPKAGSGLSTLATLATLAAQQPVQPWSGMTSATPGQPKRCSALARLQDKVTKAA